MFQLPRKHTDIVTSHPPHSASAAVLSERRSITARQLTVHGGQSKRGRHQSGQATRTLGGSPPGGHAKISPEPNNQPTGAGVWPAHVPADRTDGGHGSAAPAGPRAPSAVKRESRRLGCGPMGGGESRSTVTTHEGAGGRRGDRGGPASSGADDGDTGASARRPFDRRPKLCLSLAGGEKRTVYCAF